MEQKQVHLVMFMGQSNMAGRGTADKAPRLTAGAGYEYRAITAPDQLYVLQEPFGKHENNPAGVTEAGMKTGSMVSAFVNACCQETGVPIVGVSCAKGGSAIAEWMPEAAYYVDAVGRMKQCEQWLMEHDYLIWHRSMIWCQGCTDGDLHTPKETYKEDTRTFLHSYLRECGIERCFLIQIGNNRNDAAIYVPIQEAQEELAAEEASIVMVSRQLKTFAAKGLMKDEFHYLQEGYNLVGEEAGRKVGLLLKEQMQEITQENLIKNLLH
ncbi:MAG: sialate O-acetylesterase [Lachnospiraceae bacterium]|nr:sialate O-acetylesterase [Lachnospiraceae bacterium]